MSSTTVHDHVPVFRVVRRGWVDELDTSYSQRPDVDNRWNTPDFPALYCCCSEPVARAIVRDVFRLTGADIADLQEAYRPQLVEIDWNGEVIDVVTLEGVLLAGFSEDYPHGTPHSDTQEKAAQWHAAGGAGVVCRSASLARLGFQAWRGDHAGWSELAIYTQNAKVRPAKRRRRDDLNWLAVR